MFTMWLSFSSVQLLSHAQLFETPWTAALQASLFIINTGSLLKLMPIELVIPSNRLILCHPLLFLPSVFLSIRVFSDGWLFTSGSQSIGASASVLPRNIQGWFPLELTDLISLQSKDLLRVISSTIIQKHQFLSVQAFLRSNSHIHTWILEKL